MGVFEAREIGSNHDHYSIRFHDNEIGELRFIRKPGFPRLYADALVEAFNETHTLLYPEPPIPVAVEQEDAPDG